MKDPTAIALQTDPLTQRFKGVAVHGNTPFDVPFISQITDDLWMGGCEKGLVLPRTIEHVVSLYPWEEYATHGRDKLASNLAVRMYDSNSGPDPDQVTAIANWVNACRQTGPTLVHCQAGLNRSGLITAAALILEGRSADEAIVLLREKRSPAVLCNPAFETWLREWQPTGPELSDSRQTIGSWYPTGMDEMTKRLYSTDDAMVWAEEFVRTCREENIDPLDEGFMVGWFANAMETAKNLYRTRQAE